MAMLLVAAVFGAVNIPSIGSWCLLGQSLRGLLARPEILRGSNWFMAALLVLSALPVLR